MPTYKIIGADGKEYGPVTSEQVRQWLNEGRANAQTKVQPEGATEWQALGNVAEFADVFAARPATIAPPPAAGYRPFAAPAAELVNGPAIGLIVTAAFGFVANGLGAVWTLVAGQFQRMPPGMDPELSRLIQTMSGAVGVISCVVGIILSCVVLYGALQMKKLRSYGWAMTACILALFPCTSPCCFLGLPLGIWALVVLLKPEVKAALKQSV
jgi:hypothetical protein